MYEKSNSMAAGDCVAVDRSCAVVALSFSTGGTVAVASRPGEAPPDCDSRQHSFIELRARGILPGSEAKLSVVFS
jgi:hypothetical protein